MSTWLVPRTELTPDQIAAVEMDIQEHRVLFGSPGSGKTQVLLHRARHLLDKHGLDADAVQILVFTNVLKDYIKSALDLLRLPPRCVTTFDSWCQRFYRSYISPSVPWRRGPDHAAIREKVWWAVQVNPQWYHRYPFVLVDEGQDLDIQSFEILQAVAGHITVCVDHQQQIYAQGASESQVLEKLGLEQRHAVLLESYRCSPYIVEVAANLLAGEEQREHFRKQTRVPAEKETPLFYLASDFEDEKSRLIEVIKMRQAKGEKIGILLPKDRQVNGFAIGLKKAGLNVEVREKAGSQTPVTKLDFSSDLPKLLTYHSAKGLTFDTVLLPRLVPKSFDTLEVPLVNVLFVAVTRAAKWLYLSTEGPSRDWSALAPLLCLSAKGILSVKTREDRLDKDPCLPLRQGAVVDRGEKEDDILDLL